MGHFPYVNNHRVFLHQLRCWLLGPLGFGGTKSDPILAGAGEDQTVWSHLGPFVLARRGGLFGWQAEGRLPQRGHAIHRCRRRGKLWLFLRMLKMPKPPRNKLLFEVRERNWIAESGTFLIGFIAKCGSLFNMFDPRHIAWCVFEEVKWDTPQDKRSRMVETLDQRIWDFAWAVHGCDANGPVFLPIPQPRSSYMDETTHWFKT